MLPSLSTLEDSSGTDIAAGLRRLATLPGWLLAPLQADHVAEALQRAVPEFASGSLTLRGVKIKRMLLKDTSGRWIGTYTLAVEVPNVGKRSVALRGTFTPPRLRQRAGSAVAGAFGSDAWRCAIPELGLELEPEPPETELPAMPRLTDPEQSRRLLEANIRAGAPAYADMRIVECQPEVLSYKPGSRCTIRYHLTYPPALADRGWPTSVIAKTYRKESKGRNAYDGMVLLWDSPLARGGVVTIAEPLAYIPELKLMVQGPIAGDRSLEAMLQAALAAGDASTDSGQAGAAMAELEAYMRKAAAGLAAFHQSGVRHGDAVGLDDRMAELRDLIARLLIPAPELAGAAEPLLVRLEALAARRPDALVPTHGTFNPEQVLIDGDRVGFIDFDDFSMAEPALDVGLFRAAIKDIGMNAPGAADRAARLARLAQLDHIGEIFLAEYTRRAPIARERVALWEAWSYFRDALHVWIKVKPAEPDNALLMLTHHLRTMGLAEAPERQLVAAPAPARRALRSRLIGAGALGFGLSTLVVALGITQVEPFVLTQWAGGSIHLLFALLFVPAAAIVAAATGGAIGAILRGRRTSIALALVSGLTAALAFIGVDTALDYVGLRVETLSASATTLEVLALDDLGAALAAIGAIGLLAWYTTRSPDRSLPRRPA